MITIRTQPWNNADTGKVHNLTKYQVGLTADFTLASNILQEVNGDENNKMLNIGRINLEMPVDTVWYTRFKRFFDDGSSEADFSAAEPVYSKDVNNNKFIKSTSTIEQPSVKVEDKEAYLAITSSTAKIDGADGHLYTTYLLYSANKLVHRIMEDEVNLTSVNIPVSLLNFKILDELTVYVIYGTTNGAESPAGKNTLNTSKLKYVVDGNFGNIPYNKNQTYLLSSTNSDVIVSTAFLYNGAGDTLGEFNKLTFVNKVVGLVRTTEIYVDSEHFIPDNIYTLRLHLVNSSDESISEIKSYVITTEAMDAPFEVDKLYEYSNVEYKLFTGVNGTLPLVANANDFNISYESNYKDILLSSVGQPYSLSRFKLYPNNLELLVSKELNLSIATAHTIKTVFFTKDKRAIVLLALSVSVLRVVEFTYNPFDSIVLSKTDTTDYNIPNVINMLKQHAAVLSDDEKYIYYLTMDATNQSQHGRINIDTKAVELLLKRPDCDMQGSLINIGGNRLLSTKGSLNFNNFYIYDIGSNTWSLYGALYPENVAYLNCSIGLLRKDGKVLFVGNKGTQGRYLVVFDVEEKTYTEELLESVPSNMIVSGIVRQSNGAFIIVLSNEFNPAEKGIIYYF